MMNPTSYGSRPFRCGGQLAITLAVVAFAVSGQAARGEEPDPAVPQIEQFISDLMTGHGIPGLSVAVARENELCYSSGFGLADVENNVPATSLTRYRTASVAKPMTAVVVMSLVEDCCLNLDCAVQQYCPDYPCKEWPVTSRQLLGHLGGVRHYGDRVETTSTIHFFSLKSALSTFADDPLLHEPGTKFLYSTFGYNLLGSVAEGAGGRHFMELLQQRVLDPAGMEQTVADDQFAVIAGRARGYIRPTESRLEDLPAGHNLQPGELYNAPLHDTSMKIPGGGLLSTAPDLIRFALALNCGRLLKPETVRQMWTTQTTCDGEPTGYGLGWKIDADRNIVWHTGGQAGTSTVLMIVPDTGTCVALMCNLQHVKLFDAAAAVSELLTSTP